MTDCIFHELGHTAEVGMRIQAGSAPALFACAARAMFALVGERSAEDTIVHQVIVESMDLESLLVDWLSELLYLFETTGCLMTDCLILEWAPTRLVAEVSGGPPQVPPTVDIKAVTYHQLELKQTVDGWQAQVYFDI